MMIGSGNWSTMHLSSGIRSNLPYKAWKNGILVIETYAKGISKPVLSAVRQLRPQTAKQMNISVRTGTEEAEV